MSKCFDKISSAGNNDFDHDCLVIKNDTTSATTMTCNSAEFLETQLKINAN